MGLMSVKRMSCRAEDVDVLVHVHLLEGLACRSEILPRFLTRAVMARRPSLSMLILHTADFAAVLSCSSGMPTLSASLPPYSLIIFTYCCGTEDEPWRTIGNPGIFLSISSRMSNLSGGGTRMPSAFLVHCSGVNLYAPWLVPMEMARESTPVLAEKSWTSSGFV